MHITLKLFSYFSKYLKAGAKNYAMELKVEDGATVAQVLGLRGVPLKECRLIIINGIVHTDTAPALKLALAPGDTVAVLPNVH